MSSLNLVPNPTVLLVQAGVFLANAYVAKKMIIEPYLDVYKRRHGVTKGSQDLAVRLENENKAAVLGITARIQDAATAANKVREQIISEARQEKAKIIGQAEQEAKGYLDTMMKDIQGQFAVERAKITDIVSAISTEVYEKTLN